MTSLHTATTDAEERLRLAREWFSRSHDAGGDPDELAVAERNKAEAVLAALVDVDGHNRTGCL